MQDIPVVIVGGGLSGLYAAFLLEQKGIAYRLLEARDTFGGRIAVAKYPDAHATNNNTDIKGIKNTGETRLVFIKFSSLYKAKPVCES